MAWLRSAPKSSVNDKKPKPRYETLVDGHQAKKLPPANEYIVSAFGLIGCFSSNGMGMTPLTWGEINSFSNQSSHKLQGWESELIYTMSCEYCGMSTKAEEINCRSPYRIEIGNDESEMQKMRDRVDKQLSKLFA